MYSDDELKTIMDAVSDAANDKVTLEGVAKYYYRRWLVEDSSDDHYLDDLMDQFQNQRVRITIERLADV